ncbi:unnamed protein product [Nesidiocoris tenuis]|uniref:FAT domain-containing protein n=1 Tax=Nesidiocoris tenuis TaxID=355587 RepID=A0A6H5FXF5_9HEMI|nr:unnamed protein product [Nesidiocoris tenuis]
MQGDPGESSRPLGKEKKNEPSAGSSKDGYPSIVVSRFIDWMYDKYQSEADGNTRKLITVGIQETLMERVGQIMDTTECGDIFTTTVKLTLSLIHRYPELVSNHFQEYVTANFADAMSKFDSGDLSAASELLTWDDIQSGGDLFASERPKWLIANMMDETDFILKNIFVKKCCDPYYTLEALSSFGSAQTFAENVIEDILKDSSSEILSKACSLKYIAHAIINRGNSLITEVIKASRKAGNVRYTTKCLLNYLDQPAGGRVFHGDLAEECLNLPIEPATAPALHQLSKLLRSTCDTATSVRLSTHIAAGLFPLEEVDDRIVNSNVLRDLSKIFAAEKGHYDQLVSEQLKQIISMGIGKISDPNLTQFEAASTYIGGILIGGVIKNSISAIGGTRFLDNAIDIRPDDASFLQVDRASSETLEDQIRDLGAHSPEQISAFISAWKSDNSRVYSFFRLAVHSYFKFLTISPYKENNCKFVAATLRLLRLMVKHSAELRDVVDAELVETPVHPWIPIVPQLLARLNHADPYIRKKVEELLVKIGLEAPHLIIFPAVVGSGAMPTTKLFPMMKTYENKKDIQANEDEEEEDDDDREDDDEMRDVNERAAMMENSFHSILDSLAVKYSEEIAQVKMFVCELQRITLLWDELWLGALLQHQGDINRRFSSLQSEIKATQGNGHLDQESKDCIIKEKYRLILKPLHLPLQRIGRFAFGREDHAVPLNCQFHVERTAIAGAPLLSRTVSLPYRDEAVRTVRLKIGSHPDGAQYSKRGPKPASQMADRGSEEMPARADVSYTLVSSLQGTVGAQCERRTLVANAENLFLIAGRHVNDRVHHRPRGPPS